MDGWDNFFVAQAGAAAAFAGLVLVSISINLEKILKGRGLIGRAAEPLIVLFFLFVSGSIILIPDQSTRAYGLEILAAAIVFTIVIVVALVEQHRILHAPDNPTPPPRLLVRAPLGSLLHYRRLTAQRWRADVAEHDRGVYLLVPAMFAGFLLAFVDAWVLLIEIDR